MRSQITRTTPCSVMLVVSMYSITACSYGGPQAAAPKAPQTTAGFAEVWTSLAAMRPAASGLTQLSFTGAMRRLLPQLADDPVVIGDAKFVHMRSSLASQAAVFAALDRSYPNLDAYYGESKSAPVAQTSADDFPADVRAMAAYTQQASRATSSPRLSLQTEGESASGTSWWNRPATPLAASAVVGVTLVACMCVILGCVVCNVNLLEAYDRAARNADGATGVATYLSREMLDSLRNADEASGSDPSERGDFVDAMSQGGGMVRRRLQSADATLAAASLGAAAQCSASCPSGIGYPVLPSTARKIRHELNRRPH